MVLVTKEIETIKVEGAPVEFLMKRVCHDKVVKGNKGRVLLEKEGLYTFLGKLIDYSKVTNRLGRRGFDKGLIELLIENNVNNRDFLQDKERMTVLMKRLRSKGYQAGELIRDEEHNIYELVIGAQENEATRAR